jgi:glycine hydroxymethyltransferase
VVHIGVTEIGALIADVTKATTQLPDNKEPSKNSKAKFSINAGAKSEIIGRVKSLMDRFPVYPELDLELLKKAFVS